MSKLSGDYLKELRLSSKIKKISQQGLGKIIGSTRQHIDEIEKGKGQTTAPRYELLVKLIHSFNLNKKTSPNKKSVTDLRDNTP